MSDLARLAASIDGHEKFEPGPYKDSRGLWSFATGVCLETDPLTGTQWAHLLENGLLTVQITKAGADWLRDLKVYGIEAWFAKFPWWASLNDAEQNGLLEMGYQLGVGKVQAFHKLLACMAAGDGVGAARECLINGAGGPSEWFLETPVRATAVAQMLRTGEFP